MPALRNRSVVESVLAVRMAATMRRHVSRDTFDAEAFATSAAKQIGPELALAYGRSASAAGKQMSMLTPAKHVRAAAADFTARHLETVLADVGKRMVAAIEDDRDEITRRRSADAWNTLARNELTTAITQGGEYMAGLYHLALNTWPASIWQANRGACESCVELNGRARDVWELTAPQGPPHHVGCSCWILYRG